MSPDSERLSRNTEFTKLLECGVRPVRSNPIDLTKRPEWTIAKTVIGMYIFIHLAYNELFKRRVDFCWWPFEQRIWIC